jgi:hypothetical protein
MACSAMVGLASDAGTLSAQRGEAGIAIAGERHHDIGMTDPRAIMAARNNADWYAMMFDVHGLRYHRSEIAFLALDTPPPYHSWMTTLDPTAQRPLLELISQHLERPGFGLKDAFHCLELRAHGLTEHFCATWIWADTLQPARTTGWTRITSVNDLLRWEAAWKGGGSPSDQRQFPAAILGRPEVHIWGRNSADGFDAGAVANLSSDCVGLSNSFGRGAFPAAATLCAELAQGLPVVGYERGDDLSVALDAGFEATGLLRIWGKPVRAAPAID